MLTVTLLVHTLGSAVLPSPALVTQRPAPEALATTGPASSNPPWQAGSPATRAGKKLLELAATIEATRTDTVYSHRTHVRSKDGVYHFDCSGMINWMLARVAKRALESINRERPVAASYVRVIQAAPTTRSRGGWQHIDVIGDVEPGDLFAWRRPKDWPKGGNSGHVGIVLAKPAKLAHVANAYVVRVLDSTRWRHQDDTRGADETGFGIGTILFVTDDDGHPIGYGWHGSNSKGYYETDVVFGRVH
jgi:hypothetical protein